jgi:poly(3-hydroxybutyrate) depolymerase
MDKVKMFTVVLALACGIPFAQSGSIQVGGETRTFIVHAPTGLSNPSLVISMHGASGTGSQQQSMSGFDKIADREKFVVVYPDGISNRWDITGTKDVNFILAIIDTMAARYQIDRNRVYATGFSMGGMLSYKLACTVADKIAAIGPASGYMMGGGGGCSPSRPMPIMHIHGSADDVVDFSGLASYITGWVGKNGCPTAAQITKPYPESKSNSKVTKEYYGPCKEGSEIVVLTVEGMGHAYPGSFGSQDINASEEFWAFFKTHPGTAGVSNRVFNALMKRPVSAGYSAGRIHIRNLREIRTVQVFGIQGKAIFSWKADAGAAPSVTVPINRSAGGIYLLRVSGAEDETVLRVAVP